MINKRNYLTLLAILLVVLSGCSSKNREILEENTAVESITKDMQPVVDAALIQQKRDELSLAKARGLINSGQLPQAEEDLLELELNGQLGQQLPELHAALKAQKEELKGNIKKLLETKECPNCKLRGAALSGADLNEARLIGADLRGAYLNFANLSSADLSEANLYKANLSEANLNEAYLRGADLSGANLSGADLSEANLYKANLSEANLNEAYLRGADLSGANLRGADLSEIDLIVAALSRPNILTVIGAKFCNTTMPNGSLNNRDC